MNIVKNTFSNMLVVAVIATVSVGFAQPQAQSQAELPQLRQQAQRLMVLQALPEAAQAEAEGLLEQSQTLMDSAMTLRTERMQAFVNALEAGEAPLVARELANQAVSDARLALLRDAATFRVEVEAFLDTYPEARNILGHFRGALQGWQRGWDEDTDFSVGNQYGNQRDMMQRGNRQNMGQPGGQFGSGYDHQSGMMQRGQFGQRQLSQRDGRGHGNQPGMMQRGNRQNMGQPGMMQRGNQPGLMQQNQQQLQQQDGSGPPDNAPQGQQNGN